MNQDLPMATGPRRVVSVHATGEKLVNAAAERIAAIAGACISARGRFSIALSGGNTPLALYRHLAERFRDRIDWGRVHVWWGDERCVAPDDKDSNARAAEEALLSRVPIPAANVHRVPVGLGPGGAAEAYERELRAFDAASPLDLVLLGVGTDGHTASLFPGSRAIGERERWVVATQAPPTSPVADRVTMTLLLIAASPHALFLVSGAEKRDVMSRVLGFTAPQLLPAAMVGARESVEWYLDTGAAGAMR